MNELEKKYKDKVRPLLAKELGRKNLLAVPKIKKVVLNMGVGRALAEKQWLEIGQSILTRITGQKPLATKARKSISNFKIREGMVIGYKVTLRGHRMYDFLDKLINSAIPRFRDFYGLDTKKGFDGRGNYILGLKEHIVFPEIGMEDLDKIHGLEVAISSSAHNAQETLALLRALGFPFKSDKDKKEKK